VRVSHLLMLTTLLVFGWVGVASANGYPAEMTLEPGGIVLPGEEARTGVLSETLTFDFREARDKPFCAPFVTAEYTLENPSDFDETLEVAFFYTTSGTNRAYHDSKLMAFWNGNEIETRTHPARLDEGAFIDIGRLQMHWLNPETGEIAVTQVANVDRKYVLFSVSVQAHSQGKLVVKYRQEPSGFENLRSWSAPILHYTYLLSPAKRWAFFRDLTIRVVVPDGFQVATEPHLDEKAPGVYEERFEGLPEGDLHLSVKDVQEAFLNLLLAVAAGAAIVLVPGMAIWLYRRSALKGLVPILVGLGLLLNLLALSVFSLEMLPTLVAAFIVSGLVATASFRLSQN